MPRFLINSITLIFFLLLALVAHFKTPGGSAKQNQLVNLPAAASSNFGPPDFSQATGNQIGDGDVQATITTYNEGRVVSQVVVNVGLSVKVEGADKQTTTPAQPAAAGDIVVSQIYSGGGQPGSTFRNNYLELFNRTNSAIDFSGWHISFGSATGSSGQSISFTSSGGGIFIGAHRYLLIRFGPDSSFGAPVPWDLFVPFIVIPIPGLELNISPSGKIFLTGPGASSFGGTCPLPNSQIVDFVGYGATANCFEGTGPAPTITSNTAALRKTSGCTDSENNANDFLSGPPVPRNFFSTANNCNTNQIDNADVFVRQHYADFLNRPPDAAGLAFWTNQITSCGVDQTCIDLRRVNVSAAFFLSIEFQETGYLAYRTYKAAYGNLPAAPVPLRLDEFLPDTQQLSQNVVVNAPGWEQQLESNKAGFFLAFVSRHRFQDDYSTTMSPAELVEKLFLRAGVTPSPAERTAAINEFGSATNTFDGIARSRSLRRVAENPTLATQEKNEAFVLMQYFGYLRRNPNDPPEPTLDFTGYNFWLSKLNQFNGNFVNADMVKAFITSSEYRQRF